MRAECRLRPVGHVLVDERGQALAEFTIVLPLLLALVTAIVEFGIAFNHYVTLTDAARAGARVGAVSGTGAVDAVRDAVRKSAAGLDPDTDVEYADGDVIVTVSKPYTFSVFGLDLGRVDIQSTTRERVE